MPADPFTHPRYQHPYPLNGDGEREEEVPLEGTFSTSSTSSVSCPPPHTITAIGDIAHKRMGRQNMLQVLSNFLKLLTL